MIWHIGHMTSMTFVSQLLSLPSKMGQCIPFLVIMSFLEGNWRNISGYDLPQIYSPLFSLSSPFIAKIVILAL